MVKKTKLTLEYNTQNLKCMKLFCVYLGESLTTRMNKLMNDDLIANKDKIKILMDNQKRIVEERNSN